MSDPLKAKSPVFPGEEVAPGTESILIDPVGPVCPVSPVGPWIP